MDRLKNVIDGCIPAEMKSVEGSSGGGMSDHDGKRMWPRPSKNSRKPSRSSAVVFTARSVRRGSAPQRPSGLHVRGDLLADLLERAADEP